MSDVSERYAWTGPTAAQGFPFRRIAGSALILGLAIGLLGCSHGDSAAGTRRGGPSLQATVVTVLPRYAGLTVGQQLPLKATLNDSAGVEWSVAPDSGSLDARTSRNGQTIHFRAPRTPGVYTVTATSRHDRRQSSSVTIGVTDLPGVYTYHNDRARDGVNDREYALTAATVNSTRFGKLFSCSVDGAIYTQPLWAANLRIDGALHNVVFVGTEHDSLYAFDADIRPCSQLWKASLNDVAHGGSGLERPVSGTLVGRGDGDLLPEVGITGTPVIDPQSAIVYVVSKSMNLLGRRFYQRLHAIDLATGAEKAGSPITIAASFPGTGDRGSQVTFNARLENQRAALALVNAIVYVAWGSHEDRSPFYGWIMGYTYNSTGFKQTGVLNVAPNTREAGIWMSGAAPAADSDNALYVITGNGGFDRRKATPPNDDYGDSLLKLSGDLHVLQYFTPSNEQFNNAANNDFGAGGAPVLGDLPAGSPITHLAIGGGKDGHLYVVNRDSLGGFGDDKAWQQISIGTEGDLNAATPGVIFSVPALWNNYLYIAGAGGPLEAYRLDAATAHLSLVSTAKVPPAGFSYPGSTPSVSSRGNADGIVWILDNGRYCTPASPGCGASVLHAYDATDVGRELWNSSEVVTDAAGYAVKFTVPTIANGKVYVATRGANRGKRYWPLSNSGELDVYGLKPN